MSSEQPEVETQTAAAAAQADITQQVTNPTPTTRLKNPKRVAAGKKVAEKTRKDREEQKKALARYEAIIAKNNKASAAAPEPINKASAAFADPEPEPEPPAGFSVNQWIGIGGLAVSAAGIYLKREEIMAAFKKKNPPEPPPPVEPAPQRKGIRKMD